MSLFKTLLEINLTGTYDTPKDNETAAKGAKPLPTADQSPKTAGTGDEENKTGNTSVDDTLRRGALQLKTVKGGYATTPGAPNGKNTFNDPGPDLLKRAAKPLKGLTEKYKQIRNSKKNLIEAYKNLLRGGGPLSTSEQEKWKKGKAKEDKGKIGNAKAVTLPKKQC